MKEEAFVHRTLNCGEVNLHFAEAKPDAGVTADTPLVIFLHGFPEFWWSWRHQLEYFSDKGFWAVAPDLRGYGESDKPWDVGAYEIEKLAADIAGLIKVLGREKAYVVGHDWGAMVAWAFAMEHPAMLQKLGICNVPHPLQMTRGLRRPEQMKKSSYIFLFQVPKIPELIVQRNDYAMIRKTFTLDGVPAQEIERYIAALRIPGVVRSAINYYRAVMRRVATGRTPKTKVIEAPVLVLWGDKDRYLGVEMSEPPKRFVPHQKVVHFPNASHWVQLDEAAAVNEELRSFFQP